MAQNTSTGKCNFCGREFNRGGMARHLRACPQRKEAIATAAKSFKKLWRLYHLQIQDQWSGEYWLQLEIRGHATLDDLDDYLRAIWLECCGHLSQFSVDGWRGAEIDMDRRIDQTFRKGTVLTHIYDFGSSTYLLVKMMDARNGAPLTKHPIYLMARNNLPVFECDECGAPSVFFCRECSEEAGETICFCDEHAHEHEKECEGLMPLVNSPRAGVCGYRGPANPPY